MSEDRTLDGLPVHRTPTYGLLVVVTVLETLSLAVLLINLGTSHNQQISQIVGPVHGSFYLIGIALTWTTTKIHRVRLLSIIPSVGAAFALVAIRSANRKSLIDPDAPSGQSGV